MYHSFLIHSSADGHLGCFHVLAIINSVKVFSNELVLHIRWPKYWSITFSISSTNEYSGLISFRILAGLISLLSKGLSRVQHHNSKASILQHAAFFMVQLSHPYMTTGKTIALTIQTLGSKVMSLFLVDCLGLS